MKILDCEVMFNCNKMNPSITIKDSYKLKIKNNVKKLIKQMSSTSDYVLFCTITGFKRSLKSMINECCAHNWLYDRKIRVNSTKDSDIDNNESKFRKFCYWCISLLYV